METTLFYLILGNCKTNITFNFQLSAFLHRINFDCVKSQSLMATIYTQRCTKFVLRVLLYKICFNHLFKLIISAVYTSRVRYR